MTFDPGLQGWKLHRTADNPGFTGLIGPLWTRQAPDGLWQYAFQAQPQHLNAIGIVHGGMLMSFADHALGMMVWHAVARRACATVSLNNQFVAPARTGEWVEAAGRIVRQTRSLVFIQGSVSVGGAEVLICDGIWKILGEK